MRWTALVLAGLVCSGPAAAIELPPPEHFATNALVVTTPSGLRVVLDAEAGAAQVTAQWSFDTGANDDDPALGGLAHLVEHLAFGPLGTLDSPDYDTRLGALGGASDGWTDRERSGLGATVPTVDPEAAFALLRLEADRWAQLRIDTVHLGRQRRIVQQEIAEILDHAHGPDRTWLDLLLWSSGEPWGRHPQAPPNEAASVVQAEATWARMRSRAVLVLAGEFDVEAMRAAVMEAFVDPMPTSPPHQLAVLGELGCEPAASAVRWRTADVAEGALYMAWPIPGRDHPDRIPLEALARWMGGARISIGRGCGEWVIERRGGWWRLGAHAKDIRRAVLELGTKGLDEATVHRLRTAQLTDFARAGGLLELRARIAGGCLLAGRSPTCLAEEAAAWAALTPASIQGAAARWLLPEAATTLAVLPPGTWLAPAIPGISRWAGP